MLNFLKNNFARLYNVLTAKNGNEALARLEENTIIDVIITDILMPEMDGVELCKAIRSMTMFCHIPIILLTAQTDIRSKTEGLDYGADVFIEKPFSRVSKSTSGKHNQKPQSAERSIHNLTVHTTSKHCTQHIRYRVSYQYK